MIKRIVLVLLLVAAVGAAAWAAIRFGLPRWKQHRANVQAAAVAGGRHVYTWSEAVEKVKADRGEPAGVNARVEVSPELKHYTERHWFLATQVAEVAKYGVPTCQDYMDLAAMIQRGELTPIPAVTDSYVLFGVGEETDESVFTRYEDGHNVELYNQTQLSAAYKDLDQKRSRLNSDIASLKTQAGKLNRRERAKQRDLQKQISALQSELNAIDEDKAQLDESYGQSESRDRLFRDYDALQALAKNFNGRSYDINSPADRQALKMNMLSSLRPQALKVMEEVASAYQHQFDRPLPVSSLVRPEQYQRALRRVNRNAVLIDTPPHSTGLAFDIDFRYMSAAEQSFVMGELARLKTEGRIEVIRERNANYHVFAFVNGSRPSDDLITESLEEARGPVQPAKHAAPPKRATGKSRKAAAKTTKSRCARSNVARHQKRRH
ncbi:MAG TPA: DUF5715 family protein [Pyrinomonadaceae bacterium]|nr:DUF5715 family protein [Pyrinomonadaceae bacterium]